MRLRDAWITVFFLGSISLLSALGVIGWELRAGDAAATTPDDDYSSDAADVKVAVLPDAPDVECRLWNVLRPVDASHDTFWIGGWVEECDGVLGPVVKLGPKESREEVALRLENAVAQINQLQNQLQVEKTFASPSEP